jgi:hypothetical protein
VGVLERAYVRIELGKGAAAEEAQGQPPEPGLTGLNLATIPLLAGDPAASRRAYEGLLASSLLPGWNRGWYTALARYGAGRMTERDLFDLAGASRLLQCEAHFNAGLQYLSRGDRATARSHFEAAVRTRVFVYLEHEYADIFLARMDAVPDWPPWIPAKK